MKRYCVECHNGLRSPKLSEMVRGYQICDWCYAGRGLTDDEKVEVARSIEERIEELEKKFTDPIGWRDPQGKIHLELPSENIPEGWKAILR